MTLVSGTEASYAAIWGKSLLGRGKVSARGRRPEGQQESPGARSVVRGRAVETKWRWRWEPARMESPRPGKDSDFDPPGDGTSLES